MKKLLNFIWFIIVMTIAYPIIVLCCFCTALHSFLDTFIDALFNITGDIYKEFIKQIKDLLCSS